MFACFKSNISEILATSLEIPAKADQFALSALFCNWLLSVDFEDQLPSEKVEAIIYKLETQIKGQYPEIRRLFIEAQDKFHHYESTRAEAKRRLDEGEDVEEGGAKES